MAKALLKRVEAVHFSVNRSECLSYLQRSERGSFSKAGESTFPLPSGGGPFSVNEAGPSSVKRGECFSSTERKQSPFSVKVTRPLLSMGESVSPPSGADKPLASPRGIELFSMPHVGTI